MTETTNYDLILVEGTDLVNPLTQVNPNFETIDEQMKKNEDSSITTATELLTGSVHGLLRANADAPMFRFTATANYTAGETFTVDGVQVTALTTSGEALGSGAYIIGSEVLGCLKGTLLTLYVTGGTFVTADNALKLGGQLPSYYGKATDVTTAQDTASAASTLAQSCQTQINDLTTNKSAVRSRQVVVTTDNYHKVIDNSAYGTPISVCAVGDALGMLSFGQVNGPKVISVTDIIGRFGNIPSRAITLVIFYLED